jgi:hypothetical protein
VRQASYARGHPSSGAGDAIDDSLAVRTSSGCAPGLRPVSQAPRFKNQTAVSADSLVRATECENLRPEVAAGMSVEEVLSAQKVVEDSVKGPERRLARFAISGVVLTLVAACVLLAVAPGAILRRPSLRPAGPKLAAASKLWPNLQASAICVEFLRRWWFVQPSRRFQSRDCQGATPLPCHRPSLYAAPVQHSTRLCGKNSPTWSGRTFSVPQLRPIRAAVKRGWTLGVPADRAALLWDNISGGVPTRSTG